MSFVSICDEFKLIRERLKTSFSNQASYPSISKRFQEIAITYEKVFDIFGVYCTELDKRNLPTNSRRLWIRALSDEQVDLDDSIEKIIKSNMPDESYLLLTSFFDGFKIKNLKYVISAGKAFESSSISKDAEKKIAKLQKAFPKVSAAKELLHSIVENDFYKLYYPAIEARRPSSWIILFHEATHQIFERIGLQQILDDYESHTKSRWMREVLIDGIIMHYFGPSYTISLADFFKRFPHEHSEDHPHVSVRLYNCKSYLEHLSKELTTHNNATYTQLKSRIDVAFKHVETIWKEFSHNEKETQEEAEKLILFATPRFQHYTHELFSDFLKRYDNELTSEPNALTIDTIFKYYDDEIPVAVDPRLVFCIFLDEENTKRSKNLLFVKESIKRWFLNDRWRTIKKQRGNES